MTQRKHLKKLTQASQQRDFLDELIMYAKFQMHIGNNHLAGEWLWELWAWRPEVLQNDRERYNAVYQMFLATRSPALAKRYLMNNP